MEIECFRFGEILKEVINLLIIDLQEGAVDIVALPLPILVVFNLLE